MPDDASDLFARFPLAEAAWALPGHFDELHGSMPATVSERSEEAIFSAASHAGMTDAWTGFFESIADCDAARLNQRVRDLARQLHDNGVTYNVYAEEGEPQRPWALDLFPLLIEPASWRQIEAGILQRMALLERIVADVYGPQQLLERGMLPPALVQGHPGYLRPMRNVTPAGGMHLHICAFDLGRGPDGNWWLLSQRCQTPTGLGYLLENRLAIAGQFPRAFQSLRVQRLAGTYRALMESLRQMCPADADAHLALLTPGPSNETYFEDVYLARYLGLTLVEGSDLTVREERLYLKTIKGLVPIHALLKRIPDQGLDPLELGSDSVLGVPALLQVVRAGNVLVANAPGCSFLESPALLGFLPAIAQHLLDQELVLPALPTWWCGEYAAMRDALPRLRDCVIKPTYPAMSPSHDHFASISSRKLSPQELDEWSARIRNQPQDYTLQASLPLSQMPTWRSGKRSDADGAIVPHSVVLRVFAVAEGAQRWRVLPGGLARVASAGSEIVSMQRGGSSADVWAMTLGEVDRTTLLRPHLPVATWAQRKWLVTSRSAENLFWLGRYTERAENAIALARLTLQCLGDEEESSQRLLTWLIKMAVVNTLVLPGVPTTVHERRIFERALIASLGSAQGATSVGFSLRAMKTTGSTVRDRLSQEHWQVILQAEEEWFARCAENERSRDGSSLGAQQLLKTTSLHMATITGAQTDRMTRDDGWRLLSIGRLIERLDFLSSALAHGFETGAVHTASGFDAMIALFDSTITFHARYQQSRELPAMLELLVLDRDNPRALAWVADTLRGRIAKLAGSAPGELCTLSLCIPEPGTWDLASLCAFHTEDARVDVAVTPQAPAAPAHTASAPNTGASQPLRDLLAQCGNAAAHVSDRISLTYFTHSGENRHSAGCP